jgi:membrane-bound serine protease (ClpP class)
VVQAVAPCIHSIGDPAREQGYHQIVKRAGRLFLATVMLAALLPGIQARAAEPHVLVATLNGVINPITDNYISTAVDKAVQGRDTALIIAMDTPGGLDTSMRDIIKKMLGAPLPVVVFVSPSGARAASAGMYITEAADLSVMAPGTNIGSAHPVSIGGTNPAPSASPSASGQSAATDIESQKIENDAAAYARALATLHHHNADWVEKAVRQSINAPADDAVKLGVVDFESRDLDTLLQDLDGRQVVKNGQTYTLQTAHAAVDRYDLSGFDQFLQAVADPNLVYLLFLLAIIGIGFWVTHPGLIVPGVVGVIAGILAALSLFNLPINIAGVILILLAILLFVVDLKAVTHGVLTTGGIIAMTLGGLLLIDTGFLSEAVNLPLLLLTVLVIAGIFVFILQKVIAARRQPYATGEESMVGTVGTVREPFEPTGMVFVNGALWQATSPAGAIPVGTPVRVVKVDGLHLEVEPVSVREVTDVPGPQAAST